MANHFDVVPNGQTEMFYSSTPAEDRCVGHLRIDFGNGEEFYSTWWPHSAESMNNADFREDLNRMVNTLRKSLLKSLAKMRKYLAEHPAPELEEGSRGYRVETDRFEYFLRCTPMRGTYNAYIYCYANKRGEQQ